ncbi:uridine kinase [filamentous cyanobacterium CCP5]|nr:uridine kinase [filamentous cyanobacterium CCP5]
MTPAIAQIRQQRQQLTAPRALLVAISGIDGSGKGYITDKIAELLRQQQLKTAVINIDGWLNLPHQRFSATEPAQHFYDHAIRFNELFDQLVLPLRDRGSLELEADYTEETATDYRKHVYQYQDIDIILLEGIFLLKRQFQPIYDLSLWIECSFETALKRAISRSQEGLSPAATVEAYQTLYFPAQRIHFERDQPQQAATAMISNDGEGSDSNPIDLFR